MKDKLNVCLLNDSFYPLVDGVVNVIHNYASVISSSYGSASIVTPSNPGADDRQYPYDVVRYPSVNTSRTFGYRSGNPFNPNLIEKLSDRKFDIIHCHCPFASGYAARLLRKRDGIPMVFTYHTKFDYDIKRVVALKGVRNVAINVALSNISASDEVWAVSRGAADNLRSIGYEGECVIMDNGVDLPKGRVSEEKQREIDAQFSIPQDIPVYLFVGRLQWYKGIRIILDALDGLRNRGKDFRMIFVGTGLEEKEIKTYCRKKNLDGKCIFAGVIRDRTKIRAYFSRSDLFLFPSLFDTNGLVVREAAACGLASVLVRGSCASEGITDGRSGLLIDENAGSLTELLDSVYGRREYTRAIGENAMNELYLSWRDATARAVERYHIVLEKAAEKRASGISARDDIRFISAVDGMLKGMTEVKKFPSKLSRQAKRQIKGRFKRRQG